MIRFFFGTGALWTSAALIIAAVIAAPMGAIIYTAMQEFNSRLWTHLAATVLAGYIGNSLILVVGTCSLTLCVGTATAWLIARYRFFGHRILEWLLLMPAAIPPYITAYCYTDIFADSALNIRSRTGAAVIIGCSLYPYVYLLARTAFLAIPQSLYEVAALHNKSPLRSVALPIAKPAVIAGTALVAMETLADFGTVEFFAVDTITLGIFNAWLGFNSITLAAQLSLIALAFVFILLSIEIYTRGKRQFAPQGRSPPSPPIALTNIRAILAAGACCLPPMVGFVIPVGLLLNFVIRGYIVSDESRFKQVIANSLTISLTATAMITILALFLILVGTYKSGRLTRIAVFVSIGGYALPGLILAIGVLVLGGIVGTLSAGVFLGGGIMLLLMAYVVRFNAIGYAAIADGVRKLPRHWLSASLVLGHGFADSMRRLALPLLRPSIATAALATFVEVMKELPMTLLLRPFDFDTLATLTYEYAHSELLEEAALPALLIIAVGLFPIWFMNNLLRRRG